MDPAEQVARVAAEKRAVLLRAYRGRLRHEDLEDCLSQATLELLVRARRGGPFQSPDHIANALEQKFCSRIADRHRALGGRSAIEAALAGALPIGDADAAPVEVADPRASTEAIVESRQQLTGVLAAASELTHDQRLVLVSQLQLDLSPREFCAHFGWSAEKYRKVAQRGRARLRLLVACQHAPAGESEGAWTDLAPSRFPSGVGGEHRDASVKPTPLARRRVRQDAGDWGLDVSAYRPPVACVVGGA